MQAVSANPRVSEPTPDITEDLSGSGPKNVVIEKFALNMAKNIFQSFMSQMGEVGHDVDFVVSGFNQNQEIIAEGLASEIIDVDLKEPYGGQNLLGHKVDSQISRSVGVKADTFEGKRDLLVPGTDTDTQPCPPPLYRSGLPILGSLDYPDAPPTTPILPELERSSHSFTRKLKGGLAKVFPPSPPPPTPKDENDSSDGTNINRGVELMEYLTHSLPTDDLARDYLKERPQHGTTVEAFAEALSCDIMNWVLNIKEQISDDADHHIHLLAHQLAETIINSSLDEAKRLF